MEKMTINFPADLKQELKLLAKQTGRSESSLMREAVQRFVDQQSPPRPLPRFVGMVSDGSRSAADDEAYLEEHWIGSRVRESKQQL